MIAERKPRVVGAAGHGCGHHLFGTASTAAAIAVKDWMKSSGTKGTLRLYGTPAEEGGSGKVYMVRAGLFDDVDVVLHWHASDKNDASPSTSLANRSAKFRFTGYSSHAAGSPHRGRSALDGIEAMNHMVNLMREHVPQETRIHYVITRGGGAPNVVPDFAEAFYYVRHPEVEILEDLWDRVVRTAEGAAMGTGTTMDFEIIHGNRPVLRNDVLQKVGDFFSERLTRLAKHGVCGEQVALDPGIGFGKNLEHNIKLLSELNRFSVEERPILVGVSRKSFIGKLLDTTIGDRLPASLACAVWAAIEGAQIVRVHDVAETAQAVRMAEALNRDR